MDNEQTIIPPPHEANPLQRKELRQGFIDLLQAEEEAAKRYTGGFFLAMPPGTNINGNNLTGLTMEEILKKWAPDVDAYEPQQPNDVINDKPETSLPIPGWLKGKENLIWRGASENPLWKLGYRQDKNGGEVTIFYERGTDKLTPGQARTFQSRDIEPISAGFSFTPQEFSIFKAIYNMYIKLEADYNSDNPNNRKEARKKMLEVIEEENILRHSDRQERLSERIEAVNSGLSSTEENILRNPDRQARLLKRKNVTLEQVLTLETLIIKQIEKLSKTNRAFDPNKIQIKTLVQKSAEILSQLVVLNRSERDEGAYRIRAGKMKHIKSFPTFDKTMNKLSLSLEDQAKKNLGLTLLIGEAGTGKNIAVESFAYHTNRPFFWFPCARGMEAGEMLYRYEFDTSEGTKKFFTDLTKGLQTPGAVILIDEVNALKPPVQAILHGLGDGNRAITYDGQTIKVAEGVLIVLASNPATYGSAGNLGEALLSRTHVIPVDYPKLHKGELKHDDYENNYIGQTQKDNGLDEIAADEILTLYDILPELKGLTPTDFELLWDTVLNHPHDVDDISAKPELYKLFQQQTIKDIISDLKDILVVANEWRHKYTSKQGGFDTVGFSIRDSIRVVSRYAEKRNVRQTFLEIYEGFSKNPIDGTDSQYEALKQLLSHKVALKNS